MVGTSRARHRLLEKAHAIVPQVYRLQTVLDDLPLNQVKDQKDDLDSALDMSSFRAVNWSVREGQEVCNLLYMPIVPDSY